MRIIARFEKKGNARFASHLDLQRAFQRAFRRADLPTAYSQGFNPHPILAFASALSVGFTSEAEWLDIRMEGEMPAEQFIAAVNPALPAGLSVLEAVNAEDSFPALTTVTRAAAYRIDILGADQALIDALDGLMAGEIRALKHTKSGMKMVDIRPQIYAYLAKISPSGVSLGVTGRLDASGSFHPELLMKSLFDAMGKTFPYGVHRLAIYSQDGRIMPAYAAAKQV